MGEAEDSDLVILSQRETCIPPGQNLHSRASDFWGERKCEKGHKPEMLLLPGVQQHPPSGTWGVATPSSRDLGYSRTLQQGLRGWGRWNGPQLYAQLV